MANEIQTVRAAVVLNHGGFEKASDAQIRALWTSLTEETQKRYLEALQKKVSVK